MKILYYLQVCGDSVFPEVQTAMANAWCLAGRQARALEILKGLRYCPLLVSVTHKVRRWHIHPQFRSRNHHIPVKSLALLLESAQGDENYTLAAEVSAIHIRRQKCGFFKLAPNAQTMHSQFFLLLACCELVQNTPLFIVPLQYQLPSPLAHSRASVYMLIN